MLRTAHITLTSVGIDTGPYNIYVIDDSGITTLVASNIAQSTLLTTGYDINVADNIVTVRVESVNPTCSETALNISVPSLRVNVRSYGAVGDGVTNDTEAIQTAIDENEYIYIPEGNYLVDTLVLRTNTNILGDGTGKSQITRRYVVSSINPFNCLILATSDSPETKVSNITLNGLTLYGESDIHGFSEFVHLLYLVGTDNVTVTNCEFKAFRGDGIDLGGFYLDNPGYGYARHNSNVTISNCVFNGVNKENRNGISIIDCTGLLVENCEFKNCSKSTMPGAIDFEPDLYFNVIENCIIRNNTFNNIGGNSGVICIAIVDRRWDMGQSSEYRLPYTVFPTDITIEGNTITNILPGSPGFTYVYRFNPTAFIGILDGVNNILFKDNTLSNCATLFDIQNANGLVLQDNTFIDCTGLGYISYPVTNYITSRNITISGSTFERCGTINENGIRIFNIDTLLIDSCQFIDCGKSAGSPYGNGIDFSGAGDLNCYSYNVSINNNIFSSPTGRMTYAIRKESNHTYNPYTNQFNNNTLNGLPYNFPVGSAHQLSVKDYGALGNGVYDDTIAIQATINAAIDLGINKIYFPNGTYIIRSYTTTSDYLKNYSLLLHSGLEFSGHGNTSIIKTADHLFDSTTESANAHIFYGANIDNVKFSNLLIDQNGANNLVPAGMPSGKFKNHMAIRIDNGSNFTIDYVTIKNCSGMNMIALNTDWRNLSSPGYGDVVNVTNCTFLNGGRYVGTLAANIHQTDFSFIYFEWDHVNVKDNHIEQEDLDIALTAPTGGLELHGSHCVATGNNFIGCYPATYITSLIQPVGVIKRDILFAYNTIINCIAGITFFVGNEMTDVAITNNTIGLTYARTSGLTNTSVGIQVPFGNSQNYNRELGNNALLTDIRIQNNTITGNLPGNTTFTSAGMVLNSFNNSEISGNTITGMNYCAVSLEGSKWGLDGLDILNNTFTNYIPITNISNPGINYVRGHVLIQDYLSTFSPPVTTPGFNAINVNTNTFVGYNNSSDPHIRFFSAFVWGTSTEQSQIHFNTNTGAGYVYVTGP
jgi:hypothetical protein